jgi:hypothetical protein
VVVHTQLRSPLTHGELGRICGSERSLKLTLWRVRINGRILGASVFSTYEHLLSSRVPPSNELLLTTHALYHIEEFLAVKPLLVMNRAGEFGATRAMVHLVLDRALKNEAGMSNSHGELFQLLLSRGIGPRDTAVDGTESLLPQAANFTR